MDNGYLDGGSRWCMWITTNETGVCSYACSLASPQHYVSQHQVLCWSGKAGQKFILVHDVLLLIVTTLERHWQRSVPGHSLGFISMQFFDLWDTPPLPRSLLQSGLSSSFQAPFFFSKIISSLQKPLFLSPALLCGFWGMASPI